MEVQTVHFQNQTDKKNTQEHSMCNAVANETKKSE